MHTNDLTQMASSAKLFKRLAILSLNSKINKDKYPYSEKVMTLIKNIFTWPCLQHCKHALNLKRS